MVFPSKKVGQLPIFFFLDWIKRNGVLFAVERLPVA
jgi:hypothetical protein